jgi:hypothetical protein
MVERMSQELVEYARKTAQESGAPYRYCQGKQRKEKVVDAIPAERRHPEGLLAVLCVQETCRAVKLRHGQDKPSLHFCRRPQRVLYYYYVDRRFGRVHVRLQTWFPFTIQVYVNGHECLGRQMLDRKVGFVQEGNCFTKLDAPELAQSLADRFPRLSWRSQLNQWAAQVNPLLREGFLSGLEYYWEIDQAEYSTDLVFRDREAHRCLYPRLLDHAAINFSAQDIFP